MAEGERVPALVECEYGVVGDGLFLESDWEES